MDCLGSVNSEISQGENGLPSKEFTKDQPIAGLLVLLTMGIYPSHQF